MFVPLSNIILVMLKIVNFLLVIIFLCFFSCSLNAQNYNLIEDYIPEEFSSNNTHPVLTFKTTLHIVYRNKENPQNILAEDLKFINQQLINIKTQNALSLSLSDVGKNIRYLDNNNLDTTIQTKIFWEKIFQPVSTVIMLFLAMPFIFGRYRQNNLSKRILIGVLIGISFFIVSSILPNIGIVLGIYPFFDILLTNALFVVIGYYLYMRQLEIGLR